MKTMQSMYWICSLYSVCTGGKTLGGCLFYILRIFWSLKHAPSKSVSKQEASKKSHVLCFLIIYSTFPITLCKHKHFWQSRSLSAFVMISRAAVIPPRATENLMNPAFTGFATNGPWTLLRFRAERFSWGLSVHFQLYSLDSICEYGQW